MAYQEPVFLPWDGRRVPLTFVAGYLGAGKTTLINAVLRTTDRPIAVIVNDVGAINIDARLIRKRHGDTIELTDGCVCCSSVEGLGAAFDQIRRRPEPPDHVLVELSGVAEPARMLPWARTAGCKLDGVITLVAADQFMSLVVRPDIGEAVQAQVSAADLVVITKVDLVRPHTLASIRHQVSQISHGVPIVAADDPDLATTLLRLGGRRPGGTADLPPSTLFDRHVVELVVLPTPITRAEIDRLLGGLGPDVMRAKGVAEDPEGVRWLIQVVGRRHMVTPLADIETEPPTDLVVVRVS